MENRNELSDIVLEKGDSKTLKMKRILILVAFLILVFLVALASMKLMHKDPNKDASKLILPPEPSSQDSQIPKDDQLFKQVPIIEENSSKKESFEDMIKTLKEKEAQKQGDAKATTDTQAQDAAPSTTTETPVSSTKTTVKPKEEAKKEVAPKTTTKAPSTPTSSSTASSGHAAEAGIYVQVGAVATAPEQRVLNDIKSKGFDYRIYSTVVNGNHVTKLLVGPYTNSSEAESALARVRASLNKDAFIYRVK